MYFASPVKPWQWIIQAASTSPPDKTTCAEPTRFSAVDPAAAVDAGCHLAVERDPFAEHRSLDIADPDSRLVAARPHPPPAAPTSCNSPTTTSAPVIHTTSLLLSHAAI